MKPIIKVIFCIIILFNASCDFEWMATDKAYLIRVRNNSNQSVYYYTEYILPDTMLSVNKPHWLREVPSGQQREFYDTEVNDKKFKRLKSGERITLFILDKDIVETHKWEYIRENDYPPTAPSRLRKTEKKNSPQSGQKKGAKNICGKAAKKELNSF